jgi:serine/threonine protein kinase
MTWKALRHPNVLPMMGVTMTNNKLMMVSEWMINGNINQFAEAHWEFNRFELVGARFPLVGSFFSDHCSIPYSSKTLLED